MRGKLSRWAVCRFLCRITPADAGKTCRLSSNPRCNEDHPRGCGENLHKCLIKAEQSGSPPRMRGKLPSISSGNDLTRITPADAGKTLLTVRGSQPSWDHPRGCGENLCFQLLAATTAGSPPRMRGKLHLSPKLFKYIGITPADAGKTACSVPSSASSRDHPRGCGENTDL